MTVAQMHVSPVHREPEILDSPVLYIDKFIWQWYDFRKFCIIAKYTVLFSYFSIAYPTASLSFAVHLERNCSIKQYPENWAAKFPWSAIIGRRQRITRSQKIRDLRP